MKTVELNREEVDLLATVLQYSFEIERPELMELLSRDAPLVENLLRKLGMKPLIGVE